MERIDIVVLGVESVDELGDLGVLGILDEEFSDRRGCQESVVPEAKAIEVERVLEALAGEVGEVEAQRRVLLEDRC